MQVALGLPPPWRETPPPSCSIRTRRRRKNEDGSLTVRFKAGGLNEMCWHLVTWQESVTVEQPLALRQRLASLCATLAAHHARSESDAANQGANA